MCVYYSTVINVLPLPYNCPECALTWRLVVLVAKGVASRQIPVLPPDINCERMQTCPVLD